MAGDTVAIGRKEGVHWLPPGVAGPLWFWHARIEVGALFRRVGFCRLRPPFNSKSMQMVTSTTTQKIWARLASLQHNLERFLAFRSILVAAGQLRKKSGSCVVFEYWVTALASRCTTLIKLTCLQYLAFLSISFASIFDVTCEVWKHTSRRHFDAVSSQCTGLSFHQYQRNVAKDERGTPQ